MDLIERLDERVAHEKTIPSIGHNAADRERAELIVLLNEAAAALRAVREAPVVLSARLGKRVRLVPVGEGEA